MRLSVEKCDGGTVPSVVCEKDVLSVRVAPTVTTVAVPQPLLECVTLGDELGELPLLAVPGSVSDTEGVLLSDAQPEAHAEPEGDTLAEAPPDPEGDSDGERLVVPHALPESHADAEGESVEDRIGDELSDAV